MGQQIFGIQKEEVKRVMKGSAYLYDLRLQANTVPAQIKNKPKKNLYHIGGGKQIRKRIKENKIGIFPHSSRAMIVLHTWSKKGSE